MFKHLRPRDTFLISHHILLPGPIILWLNHGVKCFSFTPKVLIVFQSQYCFKIQVYSLFRSSRWSLNYNPLKNQKQITYFQHTMTQHIHCHYNRGKDGGRHGEKMPGQSEAKTQQNKLQILYLHVSGQRSLMAFPV